MECLFDISRLRGVVASTGIGGAHAQLAECHAPKEAHIIHVFVRRSSGSEQRSHRHFVAQVSEDGRLRSADPAHSIEVAEGKIDVGHRLHFPLRVGSLQSDSVDNVNAINHVEHCPEFVDYPDKHRSLQFDFVVRTRAVVAQSALGLVLQISFEGVVDFQAQHPRRLCPSSAWPIRSRRRRPRTLLCSSTASR